TDGERVGVELAVVEHLGALGRAPHADALLVVGAVGAAGARRRALARLGEAHRAAGAVLRAARRLRLDGDVLVLEAAARSVARDADRRRDEALRRRLDGLVRDDGRVALDPELGVLAGVAVRDLLDDVDAPAVVAAHGQLELPVRAIVVRDGEPVAVRGD